ncbi:MAG: T9SS type A sorting domain-containing protein [Bacteroidetes bacterium]|nr:T9SS type A sorting domain-containing protein [Bacteroidota bacterium]
MKTLIKKQSFAWLGAVCLIALALIYANSSFDDPTFAEAEKVDKLTEIGERFQQEFDMTVDPALGEVPKQRLLKAYKIAQAKRNLRASDDLPIFWNERGPNNVGGRTRTILIDANDASGQTIWAGSVAGGIWRTNNIDAAAPNWVPINDLFQNLSVSSIVQDPTNPNSMFFGTGECWGNGDAVRGLGIWTSTDGGASWAQMPPMDPGGSPCINKLLFDNAGTLYAATSNQLRRFDPFTGTWPAILGAGTFANNNFIADVELGANGDLYAAARFDGIYRSTDGGTTWNPINAGLPTANFGRIELATAPGNAGTLYVIYADTTTANAGNCLSLWQSTDFGATWTQQSCPGNFGSQAWYDLILGVDPNDANRLYAGGVGISVSDDGGASWNGVANIHADHHAIVYYPGDSDQVLFGNDGGVYKSYDASNNNPGISDKNPNYNVTQFYAMALHPDEGSNYMLGGTQDNATPKFQNPGLSSTTCVLCCCDGGWTFVDQDDPSIQIASTQNGSFSISTDGGGSFGNVVPSSDPRLFITPAEYDDAGNILYISDSAGRFIRVSDVGGANTVTNDTVPALNGNRVSAMMVSPSFSTRLYLGTTSGGLLMVDNADMAGAFTVTNLNTTATGWVSSIAVDPANESHIVYTLSNYGVTSIWETTDGGTTWGQIEGDLPDMPVRWFIFAPGNTDQGLIATELGVWYAKDLDGANTVWYPSNEFGLANCRTDMLQTRASDDIVAAATHGRGIYTTDYWTLLNGCEISLDLSGTIAPGLYMASEFITSDGEVLAGSNVIYQAGEYIELLPDFTAEAGSNFWGIIRDCTPAMPLVNDADDPLTETLASQEAEEEVDFRESEESASGYDPGILVRPNPTRDMGIISFELNQPENVHLYMMDATGKLIRMFASGQLEAGIYDMPFEANDMKPGIYMIVMRTATNVWTERIVVVR